MQEDLYSHLPREFRNRFLQERVPQTPPKEPNPDRYAKMGHAPRAQPSITQAGRLKTRKEPP